MRYLIASGSSIESFRDWRIVHGTPSAHSSDQGDAMLHPVPSAPLRTSELLVRMIVGQDEMIRRASTSAETTGTALVALLAY